MKSDYEQGTVKVVWIESEVNRIYSKMFADEKTAESFGSSKRNYIIFSLVKQKKMEEFEWQLLPFGHYRFYRWLIGLYQKYEQIFRWAFPTMLKK